MSDLYPSHFFAFVQNHGGVDKMSVMPNQGIDVDFLDEEENTTIRFLFYFWDEKTEPYPPNHLLSVQWGGFRIPVRVVVSVRTVQIEKA